MCSRDQRSCRAPAGSEPCRQELSPGLGRGQRPRRMAPTSTHLRCSPSVCSAFASGSAAPHPPSPAWLGARRAQCSQDHTPARSLGTLQSTAWRAGHYAPAISAEMGQTGTAKGPGLGVPCAPSPHPTANHSLWLPRSWLKQRLWQLTCLAEASQGTADVGGWARDTATQVKESCLWHGPRAPVRRNSLLPARSSQPFPFARRAQPHTA